MAKDDSLVLLLLKRCQKVLVAFLPTEALNTDTWRFERRCPTTVRCCEYRVLVSDLRDDASDAYCNGRGLRLCCRFDGWIAVFF